MCLIARVYAVNMAVECLLDNLGIWSNDITYHFIARINEHTVERYYEIVIYQKKRLIETAHQEIEMVRSLIGITVPKYEKIIEGAGEMDICLLDQACADIDTYEKL